MASFIVFDGFEEVRQGVAALRSLLTDGTLVLDIGRTLSSRTERVLRQLTPVQSDLSRVPPTSRGFGRLVDQWETIEHSSSSRSYSATVRNRAANTPDGLAVLNSLESGARPHTIVPRQARFLVWRQPGEFSYYGGRSEYPDVREIRNAAAGGGRIRAKIVNHPGHRPFRILATGGKSVEATIDALLDEAGRQMDAVFLGRITSEIIR